MGKYVPTRGESVTVKFNAEGDVLETRVFDQKGVLVKIVLPDGTIYYTRDGLSRARDICQKTITNYLHQRMPYHRRKKRKLFLLGEYDAWDRNRTLDGGLHA